MKTQHILVIVLFFFVLAALACSAPGWVALESTGKTGTPAAPATDTQAPSPTATPGPSSTATPEPPPTTTPEPSPKVTPAIHPLEIAEWAVYPYANLADPQNTDTRVEILVRNPNEFPVRVNIDEVELRLLNAAGEIVYTNANPTFYIWEGSWILGGETVPISACVCFETDGVTKQKWEALELVAPLKAAQGIAYTTDVDVNIGEFFSLEKAHLGGNGLGAEVKLVNTSGQVLKSFEARVIARDASHKYVGVAIYGSFVDRDNSGNYVKIEPGASGGGIVVSEIDYMDGPLDYEVTAIGILADK
jgi:hypothetical protein